MSDPASVTSPRPHGACSATSSGSTSGTSSALSSSSSKPPRRDLYEVLGVAKDATEEQIRSAYKKMALKYHPDKTGNDPEASEKFKEIAFAYSILIDSEKRRLYNLKGYQAFDSEVMDGTLDVSQLGTFSTALVALFSKMGVPIKTSINNQVLEEALNGTANIRPLSVGKPVHGKVEKQSAHFFAVSVDQQQATDGIIIRVSSNASAKFKLLYFEWEKEFGGLSLSMQENSLKISKNRSHAAMLFLGFQMFSLDPHLNFFDPAAHEPEAALFRSLDGLKKCEISKLNDGTHVFAVYGDNFFKTTPYTIEAIVVSDETKKNSLREVHDSMVTTRDELSKFEQEYKELKAKIEAAGAKYIEEKMKVDSLITRRFEILDSFSPDISDHADSGAILKSSTSQEDLEGKDKKKHSVLGMFSSFLPTSKK